MSVHMIGQPKGRLLLVMIVYTSKMGYTFYSTAFHILLKYFTVLHDLLLAWHTTTLFRTFFYSGCCSTRCNQCKDIGIPRIPSRSTGHEIRSACTIDLNIIVVPGR